MAEQDAPLVDVEQEEIVCTPAELMKLVPCLQCESTSDLRKILLLEWANFGGYDLSTDLPELLEKYSCFTCLNAKQRLQALLSLFGYIAFYDSDESFLDFMNEYKCLPCLKPDQVEGLILGLICEFVQDVVRVENNFR